MKQYRVVLLGIFVAAVSGLFVWGCAQQGAAGPKTVEVAVTDRGFEPREITVRAGQPVTLLVTRKTEATCVKEFVIADAGIRRDLPLDKEVAISLTPEKKGKLRFACPMDMVGGTIKVQ
jgi:plastocyanin domain-containing protein